MHRLEAANQAEMAHMAAMVGMSRLHAHTTSCTMLHSDVQMILSFPFLMTAACALDMCRIWVLASVLQKYLPTRR